MIKRIVKTSFFSIGSRGFLTLTNLVIMFSVSHTMGQEVLGVYSITAFFYYLFAFLTSFELTSYFGKEIAHQRDNKKATKKLFGEAATTFLIGLGAGAVILAGLILFYHQVDTRLIVIAAVSGVIFGIEKNLSGVLLGREKMQYEFIAQVVAFIMVAIPVYYHVERLDISGIYYLRIAASIVCVVLRLFFTRTSQYLERKNISLKRYNWKEIGFFSASGLSFFIQHHVDLYILSYLISKELEGAYFLALRIFLAFSLLAEMSSFALTPFISRSFRGKDQNGFDRLYSRMLKVQLAMGAVASVVLFFCRDLLVDFFVRDQNPELAADFLFYFSFFVFFRFVSYYTGNILTSTRYQQLRFYILIIAAVLLVGLEIWLGGLFSVKGIILSRAVMELFIFIAYLWAVGKVRRKPGENGK